MTSRAGSISCLFCRLQLWTHGLAPSRHSEIIYQGREWDRVGEDGEAAKANHRGVSPSSKALHWCLDTLSQDRVSERGRGGIAEWALFDRNLLWHCPFLPHFHLLLKTCPDFPHMCCIYLTLLCLLSYISIVSPCHSHLFASVAPPSMPPWQWTLWANDLVFFICSQCPEQGLAHQGPSRHSSSMRECVAIAGPVVQLGKESTGGNCSIFEGGGGRERN